MDNFVKRMIQRPNVMNDYTNVKEFTHKDDMDRDLSMSVVKYKDIPQQVGYIDSKSYHAITPAIVNYNNTGRSLAGSVKYT